MFQSEKAKLLMDHEVQKLQELDSQYESELSDWKQNLRFRKQVQLSHVMFSVISWFSCLLAPPLQ